MFERYLHNTYNVVDMISILKIVIGKSACLEQNRNAWDVNSTSLKLVVESVFDVDPLADLFQTLIMFV